MSELIIYDSQGAGIRDDSDLQSQRIKNLFFDRVRLTISQADGYHEIICFFRARDSSAARSEQYYAVYRSQGSQGEAVRAFPDALRTRVKNEYGLSFETTTDDTEVFQYLIDEKSNSGNATETDKLDDIVEMLSGGAAGSQKDHEANKRREYGEASSYRSSDPLESESTGRYGSSSGGLDPFSRDSGDSSRSVLHLNPEEAAEFPTLEQARFGTKNAGSALDVIQYLSTKVDGFAIAENPSSDVLNSYNAIISTGANADLELLGDTAEAYQVYQDRIEKIRRKQRKARQSNGSRDPIRLIAVSGLLIGIVGILIGGVYAACFFGLPVPDFIPGCGGGEDSGSDFGDISMVNASASWQKNGTQNDLVIEGTLTEDNEPMSNATVRLVFNSTSSSETRSVSTDANGQIDVDILESNIFEEDIDITVPFVIEVRHPESGFTDVIAYPDYPAEQGENTTAGGLASHHLDVSAAG